DLSRAATAAAGPRAARWDRLTRRDPGAATERSGPFPAADRAEAAFAARGATGQPADIPLFEWATDSLAASGWRAEARRPECAGLSLVGRADRRAALAGRRAT